MSKRPVTFATIGLDHGHVYLQNRQLLGAGFELAGFFAEDPDQIARFQKEFPQAKLARSAAELLEDESIEMINCAAIHSARAPVGIAAMRHGKDYLQEKPGPTSLEQLGEARRVQAETGRKFYVSHGERVDDRATIKAAELVAAGAIGKVVQTLGVAPHQVNNFPRKPWFYDRSAYGGILVDIGSHQFDQFVFFTGSTEAEVVRSQIGNLNHPEHPGLEDFGDVMLRGNGGVGYARIDWLSPDALGTWGDLRLFIQGTDGYIEVRKNIDIATSDRGDAVYLIDHKKITRFDCADVEKPFMDNLYRDITERTETALSQAGVFLAAELAIKAQESAFRLPPAKR